MIDDVRPDETRCKLLRLRPDVRSEVTTERSGQQVDEPGDDEKPRGKEVQAASPAVLIEDVGGSVGADRPVRVLKDRCAVDEFNAAGVWADRQLDERRHQIVASFAPVETRVRHQDHEAADGQRQHARGQDPMGDTDPPRMPMYSLSCQRAYAYCFRHAWIPGGCYHRRSRLTPLRLIPESALRPEA